jgi:alpha-galactosidase
VRPVQRKAAREKRLVARIVLIGAGSVVFTRNLPGDMLSLPALAGSEIVLHDIDLERLQTAEIMARRTAGAAGASPSIEAHLDRRRALDGADHVIDMVQIGGHEATLLDFEIPARHGLRQTIADTLGIGGVFRALRTIPVLLDIAADMRELCAEATFLNYTNPMPMLCWALSEAAPWLRVVGLCHSVQHTTRTLAGYVGVPEAEVAVLSGGINHQAWFLRFEHQGESLYPALDRAIERDPEGIGRTFRVELYRRFGYFVTESSEHLAEYVPWVMRHDDQLERFRTPVDEYVRRSEANLHEYAETRDALAAGGGVTISPSVEYGAGVIDSLETGTPRIIYGNVPNAGLIDNLPREACVEVPCVVDATGLHPVHVGALPPQCAALNRSFLGVCELTVRAALDGRRDHVLQACLLDPNAGASLTIDQIAAVVDELIEAHGDALPEGVRAAGAGAPS